MSGQTEEKRIKKHICIGMLAHVDAGKTTLSECMLYNSGRIKKQGRVDNGDAFLDTFEMEKARGITIFAKQAEIEIKDSSITLLDTPGHVDFSAEMERTLGVLDYAVLVISGADGVQSHTRTLWKLLKEYDIPVFIFVNKMDQNKKSKEELTEELERDLCADCIDFSLEAEQLYDRIAMSDEMAMEEFLENGTVDEDIIIRGICERRIFPCYFGSALKNDGVQELLEGIDRYTTTPDYDSDFGARIFKISRDEQNTRLTYMKITGGSLKVRAAIGEEKINAVRIYNGASFEVVEEVFAGDICAVTGLNSTKAGQGLGIEQYNETPILEPVLNYSLILPEGVDAAKVLPYLRQLEEEIPELGIVWEEKHQEILVKVMGAVQIEILKKMIVDRYGFEPEFGTGRIVYKETIAAPQYGTGHFEPLRHYAEVHLLLEPLEQGSGLEFAAACSEDILAKNWQRLILTHLEEKKHLGVLTGSEITDMRITLIAGRAHNKHTEGGDFRQATYRAVRQGLKMADSILLEPYYSFRLEIPQNTLGRALNDLQLMNAKFEAPIMNENSAVITGIAPVVLMQDYYLQLTAYTKGMGSINCTLYGYAKCHNANEVIEEYAYDSELDLNNPTGSVFCAHGAGFIVPWDKVEEWQHIEIKDGRIKERVNDEVRVISQGSSRNDMTIGTDEIDEIIGRVGGGNTHKNTKKWKYTSKSSQPVTVNYTPKSVSRDSYILVDGYNVIFAWENLSEIAAQNIDGARGKLLDILSNYRGLVNAEIIVVFDAYKVKEHHTETLDYHNIHVVYTKTAETADRYIERFAHDNGRKHNVTVVTSDGQEQIIVRGQGCMLLSSRDFEKEVKELSKSHMKQYSETESGISKSYLSEIMPEELK